MCVCSPNSSIAVLARFCWSCSDFSHCHFGHPPNMMTFVHPGLKLKAIVVCLNRVCAPSGRVSWRMGRNWLELCDIIIAQIKDLVISWLDKYIYIYIIIWVDFNPHALQTQAVKSFTSLHLPELTSRIHASLRVMPSLPTPPVTSSWGSSSPKLRQQAAWESLLTGQGAPLGFSSLVHSWDKWYSEDGKAHITWTTLSYFYSVFFALLNWITLLFEHTIDSKSIRKQSSTLRPSWFPPKSTAWWLLIAVKEKEEQGGGLVPLVGGEDHVPAKSKVVWYHAL